MPRLAEIPDKCRVAVCFRAQMVIAVQHADGQGVFLPQCQQAAQQRHGIRTAGDGTDNGIARIDQSRRSVIAAKFIQHDATPDRRRSYTGVAIAA